MAQGSVQSKIDYADRTAKKGGGSKWEIGFTFYLRRVAGQVLRATWYWHAHCEGNTGGVINSVNSTHFKTGRRKRDNQYADDVAVTALALLVTLRASHAQPWTKNDEVTL